MGHIIHDGCLTTGAHLGINGYRERPVKFARLGGLKEKTLAAYRAGIYNIIIPFDNQKDTEEIPDSVKKELRIYPVKTMDEVAKIALLHQVEQGPSPELYLHNAPVHGNYMQQ